MPNLCIYGTWSDDRSHTQRELPAEWESGCSNP